MLSAKGDEKRVPRLGSIPLCNQGISQCHCLRNPTGSSQREKQLRHCPGLLHSTQNAQRLFVSALASECSCPLEAGLATTRGVFAIDHLFKCRIRSGHVAEGHVAASTSQP